MPVTSYGIDPALSRLFPAKSASKWKKPKNVEILHVMYKRHQKIGSPDSMKVEYYYDLYNCHREWVCVEHNNFAGQKAQQWLKKRTNIYTSINTVEDALRESENFPEPSEIIVDLNGKFANIVGYVFGEKRNKEMEQKELAL